MTRYKLTQTAVLAMLAFYSLGGLATLKAPDREIFPVYSWFLFPLVSQHLARFELFIVGTADGDLDEPVLWNRAHGMVSDPESITAYHLIRALGRAVDERDQDGQVR